MNSHTKLLKIGSVAFLGDGAHTKVRRLDRGISYLTAQNIKKGYIDYSNSSLISESDFQRLFSKSENSVRDLQEDDILFSIIGTIGNLYKYKQVDKFGVSSSVAILRPIKGKILPDYLFWILRSKYFADLINRKKGGSVQGYTNLPLLGNTEIPVPNLIEDQKKIVNILNIIENKISLNNRINSELEAMAKTLYDYWFVQFDFPDKNGKPYKTSGGKMVLNKELKREIPEGWKVDSIEKCCEIIDCLHSKKSDLKYENEDSYLLQLENIKDNGLLDLANKYYVTKSEYKKWISRIEVVENDILITNAGRVAATSQVPKGIIAGIGRNITAIRPRSINPTYLFLAFRGLDIQRQIKLNTDSGAFFSSFNVKGIKKLFITRPSDGVEDKFEKMVKPFRQKREINTIENQQLSELRDWLLPMLMNGQVTAGSSTDGKASYEIEKEMRVAAEPE